MDYLLHFGSASSVVIMFDWKTLLLPTDFDVCNKIKCIKTKRSISIRTIYYFILPFMQVAPAYSVFEQSHITRFQPSWQTPPLLQVSALQLLVDSGQCGVTDTIKEIVTKLLKVSSKNTKKIIKTLKCLTWNFGLTN